MGTAGYGSLPPRSRDEARANSSTARHLGSFIEEFLEGSPSMHQASSLTNLNGKPLIVFTADRSADDEWQSKQDHLATLSTNSLHRHVDATHGSLLEAKRTPPQPCNSRHGRGSTQLAAAGPALMRCRIRYDLRSSSRRSGTAGKRVGVKLRHRITWIPGARDAGV